MTQAELKQLRTECRALAAENLLKVVCKERRARARLPTLDEWLAESQGIAFPHLPPEFSEMYAAEARDAVTALLERMQKQ